MLDFGLSVRWTLDGERLITLTGDRFLLGSQDYDLILWNVNTGEQLMSIELENEALPVAGEGMITSLENWSTAYAMDISIEGRLATVGGDNTAIIWSEDLQPEITLMGHELAVNGVMWSADGTQLLSFSDDMTVRLWDPSTGVQIGILAGHESPINQAIWSSDSRQIATAGDDGFVHLWEVATNRLIQTIEPNGGIVWSIAWSKDGELLVTGTDDSLIRLWEINTAEIINEMNGHGAYVTHLGWSPDDTNTLVSTGADGRSRIWNAGRSTAVYSFSEAYFGAMVAGGSADGRYFAFSLGDWFANTVPSTLVIIDMTIGEPIVTFDDPNTEVGRSYWNYLLFSQDNQYLLTGGVEEFPPVDANSLSLINLETGNIERRFPVPERPENFVRTYAWSPDESHIVMGALGGNTYVLDYESGDILYTFSCGTFVLSSDWSPDSTKFAIACQDGSNDSWVQIHDMATGDLQMELRDSNFEFVANSVYWSPDGSKILTGGGRQEFGTTDNPAIIWDANTGEQLLVINQHTEQVWEGAWSPDSSRIVTGSSDGTTRIWDAATGAEILRLSTPTTWSNVPAWSATGDYLAVALYSFGVPSRSEIFRVWQSTEELIEYAYECCVFRELTPEERVQFGLPEE